MVLDAAARPEGVSRSPRTRTSEPETIEEFLTGLPMSLAHHTSLFNVLGISSLSYLELLAAVPKPIMDEVFVVLQKRGMTFMESLVMRHALNKLCLASKTQPTIASESAPDTIDDFLLRLGGAPMARHAPLFRELGVDISHVPVLAQLDADSYAAFEETLGRKGLTWVERFLVKLAIHRHASQQEPLSAA